MNKWREKMNPFYQQCPNYHGTWQYEEKRKKVQNSYCLIKRFSTFKRVEKKYYFLFKYERFKS